MRTILKSEKMNKELVSINNIVSKEYCVYVADQLVFSSKYLDEAKDKYKSIGKK
jgi:hypothetical protein